MREKVLPPYFWLGWQHVNNEVFSPCPQTDLPWSPTRTCAFCFESCEGKVGCICAAVNPRECGLETLPLESKVHAARLQVSFAKTLKISADLGSCLRKPQNYGCRNSTFYMQVLVFHVWVKTNGQIWTPRLWTALAFVLEFEGVRPALPQVAEVLVSQDFQSYPHQNGWTTTNCRDPPQPQLSVHRACAHGRGVGLCPHRHSTLSVVSDWIPLNPGDCRRDRWLAAAAGVPGWSRTTSCASSVKEATERCGSSSTARTRNRSEWGQGEGQLGWGSVRVGAMWNGQSWDSRAGGGGKCVFVIKCWYSSPSSTSFLPALLFYPYPVFPFSARVCVCVCMCVCVTFDSALFQYVLKKMELRNASKRERKAAELEAKLLSKLKHPNIVSYKDSFETEEGFLYIAMGYCEGACVCMCACQRDSARLSLHVCGRCVCVSACVVVISQTISWVSQVRLATVVRISVFIEWTVLSPVPRWFKFTAGVSHHTPPPPGGLASANLLYSKYFCI